MASRVAWYATLRNGHAVYTALVLFLLGMVGVAAPGCGRADYPPGWIPPGGDIHGTLFYPRPSSVPIRKPSLKLLWTSDFVPTNRAPEGVQIRQHLSTGISTGRTCLAVLRGGISVLDERGEEFFRHAVNDISFGFLTGSNGLGLSTLVARCDSVVIVEDLGGAVRSRIDCPNFVDAVWTYDLDKDGFSEILLSERELVRAPPGSKRADWEKRMIRCYDTQSSRLKWEYRSASHTFVHAIGDLDGDGYPEVVCGTHSLENAVTYGDMIDSNHVYLFALDRFGNRKWMQTFMGPYGRVKACIDDIDGDGAVEVIASVGNWLKNWGGVYIIRGSDGQILFRYPADQDLDISITRIGVADLDGDGNKEIVCASEGKQARVFILDSGCRPTGREYRVSPRSMDFDFMSSNLVALNDVDGDGKVEIIVTTGIEKIVANDPRFMYSKWSEPQLLVLGPDCTPKFISTDIVWFSEAIISDLVPGGPNEFIVLGEEVSVYEFIEAEE